MEKLQIPSGEPGEAIINVALDVINQKYQKFQQIASFKKQWANNVAPEDNLLPGNSTAQGNNSKISNKSNASEDEFSLDQLCAFMTHEQFRDEQAHKVVVLCHKTFASSSALLEALRGRYNQKQQK
eukprot:UN32498